ncbi:unnamed protein product [Parnassius apollo]|uniref:(apollo) hypothetical protein n=1 Tax=Parnassius apollo TaxID=110799 RepID=A0A8S3YHQ5_PARAO|nr:unnamed protein product [Parnassius apollo]
MVYEKCCVGGCNTTRETHRLFRFPRNDNLRNLWMAFIVPTNSQLIVLSKEQLLNKRVCEKHFDVFQFGNEGRRLRYSYPSLLTDNEIAHGVPLTATGWDVTTEHNYCKEHNEDDFTEAVLVVRKPGSDVTIEHNYYKEQNDCSKSSVEIGSSDVGNSHEQPSCSNFSTVATVVENKGIDSNTTKKHVQKSKQVSMKEGNLILSILVDIVIGYFILELFLKDHDKKDLGYLLMGFLEKLVNSMYSLLKWLMGSPAGLKLNNAFNKMLGKYFSYHIELWWLFLGVSGEKLDIILHLYKYVGYLGFTFQAAIIADMICLATFHSYCIYVYAARLFNIQISGLTALLRLFVGRKYNPLRGGVDSCEYTNQELFVGTVAFTILLLLLPTTIMYYIVFTLFRVLSILVQYILAKSIYLIQTLPLYVIILWLTRSSKVAGNVLIEEVKNAQTSVLLLRLKLFNKSIRDLITHFRPPVDESKHIEWSNMLSNIVTGKQII